MWLIAQYEGMSIFLLAGCHGYKTMMMMTHGDSFVVTE